MVITKKEKTLIFVLILFLLVGGTFTLGIMPKNNEKKDLDAEIETIEADKEKADKVLAEYSTKKYNELLDQIEIQTRALEKYSDPSNSIYNEVQPGDLPNQSDENEMAVYMCSFFGNYGISTPTFKLNAPTISGGKKIYRLSTNYSCVDLNTLGGFIDEIARIMSYNLSNITITVDDEGKVSGTITLVITQHNQ